MRRPCRRRARRGKFECREVQPVNRVLMAVTAAGLGIAGPGVATADAVVMRVSHQLPPDYHIARLVDDWVAHVETLSGGSIDVQVFGASQLFSPADNFPAVAGGDIEAALSGNFQWAGSVPAMNVTMVPYLFRQLDHIAAFPNSDAAAFLEGLLADVGVRNLAWLYTTRTSIITSNGRPIVSLADFEGLKIRGLNRIADAGLVAAGAAPTAMPGPEVYQALQTGVIDAGLTDVSAALSRRYYEVQEFGTVAPLFSVFYHLYVNPDWWDGLTDAQRAAIEEASALAEVDAVTLTEEEAAAAFDRLQEEGMLLHSQTNAEQAEWAGVIVEPVMDAFLEAAGEDGRQVIDLLGQL